MRKKIKYISICLAFSLFVCSIGSFQAQGYNGRAYSIGCLYGASGNNLDTRPVAIQSADYYGMAGYAS